MSILLSSVISANANSKVYLVHGFAGLGAEMSMIKCAVKKAGFEAEYFRYRSLKNDVDSAAKTLFERIQAEKLDTVQFVTHSMGALVVRAMYAYVDTAAEFPHIQRIVMIAPPNKGTEMADFFSRFAIAKRISGANLENLTTDSISGAGKYPVPDAEIGLIVGHWGKQRGLNPLLRGDNDGIVQTANASLGTEKDLVQVRNTHFGILFSRKVIRSTVRFLKEGKF